MILSNVKLNSIYIIHAEIKPGIYQKYMFRVDAVTRVIVAITILDRHFKTVEITILDFEMYKKLEYTLSEITEQTNPEYFL